jgi:DNA-binding CsgD family transcriptional regulator
MAGDGQRGILVNMDERKLSIIVHSLFSSWMLALLFEGEILYSLARAFDLAPAVMLFGGITAHLAGLLICGFLIKTKKAARRLFLCSYIFFIAISVFFFFPPSVFWISGIVVSSFLAGGCVAAWGFYFRSGTPKNERIKTAADMLICSSLLMILLNMATIHLSPHVGLALSMFMLLGAFLFALRLPAGNDTAYTASSKRKEKSISIAGPLVFLCLFVVVITINSGLMYQVVNPAFAHLEWLTSWYWSIPYIVALYIMRNLPRKTNRTYILYVAIAMIGISFIAFTGLNRSAMSYLVVNTIMLGAFGIYDLFWWSILGEMLDFHKNPAQVLGIGLSANVLGVLLGGLIGNAISSAGTQIFDSTLLALAVVCVTLVLLPPLHRHLSSLLKDHAYLVAFSEVSLFEQAGITDQFAKFTELSERESQVASLLLQRKTYKAIAGELFISENTVKYYVKNIYSKFNVQSRSELIDKILANEVMASIKK